jgi:hypothetical protein
MGVMFNAFVFIGDKDSGFTLFASQRKLYRNDYLSGLYSHNLPASRKLNQKGLHIFNTWQNQWNEDNGEQVWNLEDCWPIFLLDDARSLINYFETRYRININKLT